MQPATREALDSIKIVYCAPDTLALYGIPYEMRRDVGQAPRHIWEAARKRPRGMRADLDVLAEWIPLDERDPLVKAWLARVRERDGLPGWPHEWVRLTEDKPLDRDDAREYGRYAARMGHTREQARDGALAEGCPERYLDDALTAWATERACWSDACDLTSDL